MGAVRVDQILKILELTDSFNLHRESIIIPLNTEESGSINVLPDGRIQIVCPSTAPFEEWLKEVRVRLKKMDLSKVGRR